MRTAAGMSALQSLLIEVEEVTLQGDLGLPAEAPGIVVFAHGSGSSRLSPRNRFVATALQEAGFGTLLVDLLTTAEEADRSNVFDIALLAERLGSIARWLGARGEGSGRSLGYFGASTGAAAALIAAAHGDPPVAAVVSRGGRPDLAGRWLEKVAAPTLLIVGGRDPAVLELNRLAYEKLSGPKRIEVVPGATHLFEERGTLEVVAALAAEWFRRFLVPVAPA